MTGFYSQLNSIIRQMMLDGKALIDCDDVAGRIDLSEVPRDELERTCRYAMTSTMLYQNNFRSFVKGKGLFVNYQMAKDPAVLLKLCENESKSISEKQVIQKMLEDAERNALAENGGQMQLMIDENGKPIIFEELSKQELWDLLKERIG